MFHRNAFVYVVEMVPCYIQSCSSSVLSVTRALRGLRVAPLAFGVAVDARTELPLPKETKKAKQQKKKIIYISSAGGKKRGFGNQKMTKKIFCIWCSWRRNIYSIVVIAERMSGGVAVVSESITSLLVLNPRDKLLSAVSQIVHQLTLTLFLDSQIDKTYGTPQNSKLGKHLQSSRWVSSQVQRVSLVFVLLLLHLGSTVPQINYRDAPVVFIIIVCVSAF